MKKQFLKSVLVTVLAVSLMMPGTVLASEDAILPETEIIEDEEMMSDTEEVNEEALPEQEEQDVAFEDAEEKVVLPEGELYDESSMIVVFEDDVESDDCQAVIADADAAVDGVPIAGEEDALVPTIAEVAIADEYTYEEAATEIASYEEVAYVQPNFLYMLQDTHVETGTTEINTTYSNWQLGATHAVDAWDLVNNTNTVTVAVIDTGCDLTHEDLKNTLDLSHAWQAVDRPDGFTGRISYNGDVFRLEFPKKEPGPLATNAAGTSGDIAQKSGNAGHGTHVCGIIGAELNNQKGIAGIAGGHATILPVNVFSVVKSVSPVEGVPYSKENLKYVEKNYRGMHYTTSTDVISAYEYLLKNLSQFPDLRIVNLSFGGYTSNDVALQKVIETAYANEIVTVCAGGNAATDRMNYPADYEVCISVVALSLTNWETEPVIWMSYGGSGSDHNEYKDITAPGEQVYSTMPGNNYDEKTGTSMAAPCVSGVLALMFAADPNLTNDEAIGILYDTATDLGAAGPDNTYGRGLVNAEEAVNAVLSAETDTRVSDTIEDGGIYTIETKLKEGMVLDVASGSLKNKGNLQIYKANSTNAQKFQFFKNADGTYCIYSYRSGLAIDVAGGASSTGTNVQQYLHNGTNAQKWTVETNDDGSLSLKNALGRYLSVANRGTTNMTNVQTANKTGNAQKFYATRVGTAPLRPGTYVISSAKNTSYVVDVAGGKSANKTNIQLYRSNGTKAQKFTFLPSVDGTYEIVTGFGKALDVQNGKKTSGTNVWQYTRNRSVAQRWNVQAASGRYTFTNMAGGMRLDVRSQRMANKTNIWVYRPNNSIAQQFVLKAA